MPDTERLFTNATIMTMDPANPAGAALLTRNGAVVHVGTAADLAAQAPHAERIDLAGAFVCPGFVDPHNHFALTALAPVEIDCRTPPVRSLDGLLERVHTAAAAQPPGRWLRGHGYDEALLGGRHPTRQQLDAVAPHHPVVLVHWTVHRAVANTAALRIAGIDETTGDPPGGWIVRGPAGSPTGLLYERATDPLQNRSLVEFALRHVTDLPNLFLENARLQLRQGITGIGDAYVPPMYLTPYLKADLPIAARPFCGSSYGLFAPPEACIVPTSPSPRPNLYAHGVKLFVDGGGNTTATSLTSGRPPRFLFHTQDQLNALVAAAHAQEMPVAIHAAGDIAVSMALDAVQHARRLHPNLPPRFRIEHAITVKQRDLPRFRALDVAVVTQPAAVFHAGARLAAAPLADGVLVAPFRAMLDEGVTLAFSSDSPCYALSPLFQMWCAVARQDEHAGPLPDGQQLTPTEALHAYTTAASAALFPPNPAGALRPGLPADFVTLSHDPHTTPLAAWPTIATTATYLAGARMTGPEPDATTPPGRPLPDTWRM